jgi:diaminohydroxyphosphoribosylaminopyrimidine deaminase / 5-amino-6-(5-phosphoribosylamino)uracil reductase
VALALFDDHDRRMMRRALALAKKGVGRTSPNPAVGAVVCDRRGRVIATGWHKKAGTDHAEVVALRKLGFRARGATLYVTLEPCAHTGKTPPCTEAVLRAGVGRVVVAMRDPFPLVNGRGIKQLRAAGVRVDIGLFEDEARALNEAWLHRLATGRPFVTLKLAETLDGKIATRTGDSRWVSSPAARKLVHQMRDRNDAVLVGAQTILTDDPQLTTRGISGGRDPLRIILDGELRTPAKARALPAIILTDANANRKRAAALARAGATVLTMHDLAEGMRVMAKGGICSILCEGGSETAASLLEAGLADRVVFFIAPKIAGGKQAVPSVGGLGIRTMDQAIELRDVRLRRVGPDVIITGDVHGNRRGDRKNRARRPAR